MDIDTQMFYRALRGLYFWVFASILVWASSVGRGDVVSRGVWHRFSFGGVLLFSGSSPLKENKTNGINPSIKKRENPV